MVALGAVGMVLLLFGGYASWTAEREASDDVITRVSACAETGSITPESSK